MKTQFLISIFCLVTVWFLSAQTNTFPTSGNVGVGTTSPSEKLEVNGNIRLGLPHILDSGNHLSVSSIWGNWMTFFDAYSNDTYNFHNPNNGGRLELYINDGLTNQNKFGVFTIRKSGNIGIGTSSPLEKLHINGSIRGNIDGGALRIDSGNGYIDIGAKNAGWAHIYTDRPKTIFNTPIYTTANIFSSYNNDLIIQTEGITRLVVNDDSGNVGIGTTTPDEKLAVNGNIHSKEVRVDLIGWSDFVFDKNYNLPSLKDVEIHIKEKGHLKNIPSAEDVEENGILLGDMNAKLLQKIEELTLYTIEQEKQINLLLNKVEKLEAK